MNKLFVIFLLGTFAITELNARAIVPSNTISTHNYLGSSNDVGVTFKRNNIQSGKITANSIILVINGDEMEGYFGNFPAHTGGIDVTNYSFFVRGSILTEQVKVSLKNT